MNRRVDLKNLSQNWKDFKLELDNKALTRLTEDGMVSGLKVLALVKIKIGLGNYLDFKAQVKSSYVRQCDMCLKPVNKVFEGNFKLKLFDVEEAKLWDKKQELMADDVDVDFYSADFKLEKYIEDYLILELKDYFKCYAECTVDV